MSARNSTPNYELPIFEATDKPTWQGDFNEAMNKIDTAIDSVNQKSEDNENDITSLNTDVGDLKNANENRYIEINNNNLVTPNSVSFALDDSTRYIYYNGNTIQILSAFIVSNLSGSILAGNELRTPLIKIPRNIFGLSISPITSDENKYALCNVWLKNVNNDMQLTSTGAYYDGTYTVIYLRTANTDSNVPYVFTLNVTTLNAGVTS